MGRCFPENRFALKTAACVALVFLLGPAGVSVRDASAAAGEPATTSHWSALVPTVSRSVVMVRVAAHPQVRVKGVIQPPRTFDMEGPATVIGPGVIVSSLSLFDPIKGYPPREGVEFDATIYSKVDILIDGKAWADGRVAATDDASDLIFFVPSSPDDSARLPALPVVDSTAVPETFAEYLDVTRAPAAFERCVIARVSTISGAVPLGTYFFVTSQSAGSPVVDHSGAMLGLGVRVASPGMPATSALLPAARVLTIAHDKGLVK